MDLNPYQLSGNLDDPLRDSNPEWAGNKCQRDQTDRQLVAEIAENSGHAFVRGQQETEFANLPQQRVPKMPLAMIR